MKDLKVMMVISQVPLKIDEVDVNIHIYCLFRIRKEVFISASSAASDMSSSESEEGLVIAIQDNRDDTRKTSGSEDEVTKKVMVLESLDMKLGHLENEVFTQDRDLPTERYSVAKSLHDVRPADTP